MGLKNNPEPFLLIVVASLDGDFDLGGVVGVVFVDFDVVDFAAKFKPALGAAKALKGFLHAF